MDDHDAPDDDHAAREEPDRRRSAGSRGGGPGPTGVRDRRSADGVGESDGTLDDVDDASRGLFDDLLDGASVFEDKNVLRPSYTPNQLPHRAAQIDEMATILVSALRGDTPSNILVYGKTGTGKTATAKFVSEELQSTSEGYETPCTVEYVNCEVTDTQYRVLAQLANEFIADNKRRARAELEELQTEANRTERGHPSSEERTDGRNTGPGGGQDGEQLDGRSEERIEELETYLESRAEVPMTGWPTDRVYRHFFDAVDFYERVVVIMLDEIDKLVEKSGDDTLYNLSRMNTDLENSKVSLIGISNDLKFTEFLDPRVKSSLGEEEIVFPPYDADHLQDILEQRADQAFEDGVLSEDVIPLCAAFAAQEHGDARRALDLLRTAGELAERSYDGTVAEAHVRQAHEKIELDRIVEAVRTLPTQSKLVLFAIIELHQRGRTDVTTGEVYNAYRAACDRLQTDVLTQRRVTELINELDMLGIVNAIIVTNGRYGRSKEISLSVPAAETREVLLDDSRLDGLESG